MEKQEIASIEELHRLLSCLEEGVILDVSIGCKEVSYDNDNRSD